MFARHLWRPVDVAHSSRPFFGRTRFKDFTASPEGIPTNILTGRLERLLTHGIIEQIPAQDGTKRLAYRLTQKGKAVGPVLKAMRDWGLAWDKSTRVKFRMRASTLNSVTQLAPERRLR
jgi:DNA-binding HxlR family transcriptional regulator